MESAMGHPRQPVVMVDGVRRYKESAIVRYLLDNGGIDLNQIAAMKFPLPDRRQFAQLIGYSLCGYRDLQEGASDEGAPE